MSKERAWPARLMYILIAAALAMSLIVMAAPAQKASAADDIPDAEWERVGTPTTDGWVLAPYSTIIDYALDADGEVAYAVVDMTEEPESTHLLKSDDHAATWEDITPALEKVDDDVGSTIQQIMRVATDWVDPDFVVVALEEDGEIRVYFSTDGGSKFMDVDGKVEDGAYFEYYYDVSDLAVSYESGGARDIAIGGIDNGGEAALFRCTVTGDAPGSWEDATYYMGDYGGWDDDSDFTSWMVTDIIFSPNWGIDKTVLVTTFCDTLGSGLYFDVHVQSGSWGTSPGWNEKSTLGIEAVPIKENVDVYIMGHDYDLRSIAGITLPSNYNSKSPDTRVFWAWVNYYDPATGGLPGSEIVRVDDDSASPVGPQGQIEEGKVWLTNVSYKGTIAEGEAIAGLIGSGIEPPIAECCEGVQVYRNDGIVDMDICCERWEKACKAPTGMTGMAVSYVGDDKAYAVALQGWSPLDEGAWSVTFDDGDTWNQLSLIDTWIDYLSDVAESPDCNKTFLVSVNLYEGEGYPGEPCGCDSVWLHAETLHEAEEYSGQWLRTWCDKLTGDNSDDSEWLFPEYGLLRLPPEEENGETVILVDRMSGNVYWNDLETLACWHSISSTAVDEIVDLAAQDADTLFALDESGDVAMFDEDEWEVAVDGEVDYGWTIAVDGDDIIVGGRDGDVSHSDDGGETFTALPDVAGASAWVTVAFDTYFDSNDKIYAAVADIDTLDLTGTGGIYAFVVGESSKWMDLNAEPYESQIGVDTLLGPTTGDDKVEVAYTGLVVDNPTNLFTSPENGGVIYASYIYNAGNETDPVIVSGAARSLERMVTVCTSCLAWDYLIVDLEEDGWDSFIMMPDALKICGCLTADTNSRLFAIGQNFDEMWTDPMYLYDVDDGAFGTVWTFEDCYGKKAPETTTPDVEADPCSCYSAPFTLTWSSLCDACVYELQFALDEDFTMPVPVNGQGEAETDFIISGLTSDTPSYSVMGGAAGGLSCETTYYWRVRASEAATGQVIHSWWTVGESFTVPPSVEGGHSVINLVAPVPGATSVPLTDVGFSWNVEANADEFDFSLWKDGTEVDSQTGLTNTYYQTDATLTHDTTYSWQVTAYYEGLEINKSSVGTFRTMTEAEEPVEPEEAKTPFWVWVVIAIGAVLVIVVIVLIFRTRRV